MFDKVKYWAEKALNIGSKRPKAYKANHFKAYNRASERARQPDFRNDKTHRDLRTAERGKKMAEDNL